MEMVMITKQMIEDGRSSKGGWSGKQLAALGIVGNPEKGWPRRLIGTMIPKDQADRFLALRNAHLKNAEPKNFCPNCGHCIK